MDSAALRGLLAASLDANADNRRNAELQLKQVCRPRLTPPVFRGAL
jgi:hypothetical protein